MVVYPNPKDTVNYIKFRINGQNFGERDTTIKISLNKNGFDICEAIIADDTIRFFAKFKNNEIYVIQQGCCCSSFDLLPMSHPMRGSVVFNNKTNKEVVLIVAETNADTIESNHSVTTFATESAMCMFKPCSILLTEPDYMKEEYNYKNDKRDYNQLWAEQEKYILNKSWFLFLHGEKIEFIYDEKTGKTGFVLKGYMTEEEYRNSWLQK